MNGNTSKFMAEAIGTFALCFVGAGAICAATFMTKTPNADFSLISGYVTLIGIAAAHGLILSIGVSATMNISGGHLNPAVTIAMLVTGRISPSNALQYIIAQLMGGVAAGVLVLLIFRGLSSPSGDAVVAACKLGTPCLSDKIDPAIGVLVEVLVTFLLLFAVFGTAVDARAPKIGGWGIGLTVGANIFMAGPLTGGSMNPARTFGTGVVAALSGRFEDFWLEQWVYWVGPVVGAVLAAMIYDKLILDRKAA